MENSPEVVEALAVLDAAVKNYASANAKAFGDAEPYILTWVMSAEYTNVEFEKGNLTGQVWATPAGQASSASIGMLTMTLNNFNAHTTCNHHEH